MPFQSQITRPFANGNSSEKAKNALAPAIWNFDFMMKCSDLLLLFLFSSVRFSISGQRTKMDENLDFFVVVGVCLGVCVIH